MPPSWKMLLKLAEAEVADTLARLPAPLREEAARLLIRYEKQPDEHLLREGIFPDTLGLFVGPDFVESAVVSELPAQIILFLENNWDAAEGDEEFYREEIQTTLLHELGHFLGLDEIDLEDRGLA